MILNGKFQKYSFEQTYDESWRDKIWDEVAIKKILLNFAFCFKTIPYFQKFQHYLRSFMNVSKILFEQTSYFEWRVDVIGNDVAINV